MSKTLKVSSSLLRKQKSDLDIGLENHTKDQEYLRQGWEFFFLSSQLSPVLWMWSDPDPDNVFFTGLIKFHTIIQKIATFFVKSCFSSFRNLILLLKVCLGSQWSYAVSYQKDYYSSQLRIFYIRNKRLIFQLSRSFEMFI